MNFISDRGFINLHFFRKCSHRLHKIFNDLIKEFWCFDDFILLTISLLTRNLAAFNSRFTIKTCDRESYRNVTISKSKCSSANKPMTTCLFISSVSLDSDMFVCSFFFFLWCTGCYVSYNLCSVIPEESYMCKHGDCIVEINTFFFVVVVSTNKEVL